MTLVELGILLSATIGASGTWMIIAQAHRRRSFASRLAPWLADISPQAARHARATQVAGSTRPRQTPIHKLAQAVGALWSPSPAVLVAARQAGRDANPDQWRIRLVQAGLIGSVVGGACGAIAATTTAVSWVAVIGLLVGGAGVGVLVRRRVLTRAAVRRVTLIREALPAIADLLALSVTAGESFVAALERVTARGSGPLSAELRLVVKEVHAGMPLAEALTAMSHSLAIDELTRTCDHVIAALDRGTPLADTLRVQAHEARAEMARRMQERAATREVAMLVPLIFLILPVTIAFAIFPGLIVLQSGF